MAYKVIRNFLDRADGHAYTIGDVFPDEKRGAELAVATKFRPALVEGEAEPKRNNRKPVRKDDAE